MGRIPPRALYIGSVRVRVSPISRKEYPRLGTAIAVGTNRSQERAPYFQSTRNFYTPNGYVVYGQHTLSAFGLTVTSRYPHHRLKAQLALAQISLAPIVPRGG